MDTNFIWLTVYDDYKKLIDMKIKCKQVGTTFYLEDKLKELELIIKAHEENQDGNH